MESTKCIERLWRLKAFRFRTTYCFSQIWKINGFKKQNIS